jgi:serine/threonine protein phosphatase 1
MGLHCCLFSRQYGHQMIVIGDIHGEITKLKALISVLRDRGLLDHKLIFLGDYIDRGEDSVATLDYLTELKSRYPHLKFLKGNHEQMLLESWEHQENGAPFSNPRIAEISAHYLNEFRDSTGRIKLNPSHLQFLRSLPNGYVKGDLCFTHGGIDHQGQFDLWADGIYGPIPGGAKRVIRGHVIHPEVTFYPNNIAIDTGAHKTDGSMSALIINMPHIISISETNTPSLPITTKRIRHYMFQNNTIQGYMDLEEARASYGGGAMDDHTLIQFLNWKSSYACYVLEEKILIYRPTSKPM